MTVASDEGAAARRSPAFVRRAASWGNFRFAWAEAAIIRLCCAVQNGLRCHFRQKPPAERAPRSAVCSANGRYNPSGTARGARRFQLPPSRIRTAKAVFCAGQLDMQVQGCKIRVQTLVQRFTGALCAQSSCAAAGVSKTSFCLAQHEPRTRCVGLRGHKPFVRVCLPALRVSHAPHRSSVRSSRNCRFSFSVCRVVQSCVRHCRGTVPAEGP